jgi:hypothetical protein
MRRWMSAQEGNAVGTAGADGGWIAGAAAEARSNAEVTAKDLEEVENDGPLSDRGGGSDDTGEEGDEDEGDGEGEPKPKASQTRAPKTPTTPAPKKKVKPFKRAPTVRQSLKDAASQDAKVFFTGALAITMTREQDPKQKSGDMKALVGFLQDEATPQAVKTFLAGVFWQQGVFGAAVQGVIKSPALLATALGEDGGDVGKAKEKKPKKGTSKK